MAFVRSATVAEEDARSSLWRHLWGKHLSPAELCAREASLRESAWSASAERRVLLLLLPRDGSPPAVLSSCEVYVVPALLGGTPSTVLLVATLFTEPEMRGRGFAAALLEAVAAEAAARPRCAGVLLFSDIGTAYYENLGFRRLGGATDIVLPADAAGAEAGMDAGAGEGARIAAPVVVVDPAADLGDLDEGCFNAEGETLPCDLPPRLLVLPVELQRAGFIVAFESFEAVHRGLPPLARRGASAGADGCCVWAADYEDSELLVLALRASTPAVAAALLAAAQREAAAAGLAVVRLWAPDAAVSPTTAAAVASAVATMPGASRAERTKQLPMLRAAVDAGGPEIDGLGLQRIHWW
jgi:GNAT superfamily N-acetyltransferase